MRGYWIFSIMFLGIVLFSITAYAQTSTIPDWVKNNAKWWSDGQIGESDYISSLQYLINQGIIKIPITEVTATKVSLGDDERAQSIVVFMEGEHFGVGETFYTFSDFIHVSQVIRTTKIIQTPDLGGTPQFFLGSLPSKDKAEFYRWVDQYVNPARPPFPTNITVDIIAGDGSIIQTWDYRNCDIGDYVTYLDSDKETYRYGEKEEAEFRDIARFVCTGFSLIVP